MKKNAEFPILSIALWAIIATIYYIYSVFIGIPSWFFDFISPFFISIILMKVLFFTKYEIIGDKLYEKKFFIKREINIYKIRNCEYRTNSLPKQVFFAYPERTIYIEYNKYDSIEIMLGSQDFMDYLSTINKNNI